MFQDGTGTAIQTVDLTTRHAPRAASRTLLNWVDLPSLLLRRLGWIVSSVVIFVAAGLLLCAALPRTYTANTQLLVQPTDLNAFDKSVNQASLQADAFVAQIETVARTISSTKVLERVVETQNLLTDPEYIGRPSRLKSLVAQVKHLLRLEPAPADADPMAEAVRQLSKHLTVRRSERTYVIDISVSASDPLQAAKLANAVVDAFLEVQASARADATRRISDSLTARLGELRARVRTSEDAVQKFKATHNLVVANGQYVDEQQISEGSAQLLAAQNRTADAKAKFDQIDAVAAAGRDPGAIPESLQSSTITALRTQLAQASKAYADAMTTYGARHPLLAQIKSQVDDVRRSLNGEVNRIRETARSEYDRARTSEANLRKNLDKLQTTGAQLNADEVHLRELEREAEASRSVYQAFLVRSRETAEQERVDTFNAWVMSPATAPLDRSFPPPNTIILGAALLLGAAAGLALALLRERLDGRLWTPSQAEAVTGLPILATLRAPRSFTPPPASKRSETGLRGSPVSLPRIDPQNEDAILALVQDLYVNRSLASGRVLLLLGDRREQDVALVAQWLAAAAVFDGHDAILVRFGEIDPADGDTAAPRGYRALNAATALAEARNPSLSPGASLVDFPEAVDPREVKASLERLRSCIAGLTGDELVVIASRRDAVAVPQLAELAHATLLVLTAVRTTRREAAAMLQRLRARASILRGSVFVRHTA